MEIVLAPVPARRVNADAFGFITLAVRPRYADYW
jgi:hypothetical protein